MSSAETISDIDGEADETALPHECIEITDGEVFAETPAISAVFKGMLGRIRASEFFAAFMTGLCALQIFATCMPVTVGSACSGTEMASIPFMNSVGGIQSSLPECSCAFLILPPDHTPVASCHPWNSGAFVLSVALLVPLFSDAIGSEFGTFVSASHAWSCELIDFKSRWIHEVIGIPLANIFKDITKLAGKTAGTWAHTNSTLTRLAMWFVGSSCKSVSYLNKNRKDFYNCLCSGTPLASTRGNTT